MLLWLGFWCSLQVTTLSRSSLYYTGIYHYQWFILYYSKSFVSPVQGLLQIKNLYTHWSLYKFLLRLPLALIQLACLYDPVCTQLSLLADNLLLCAWCIPWLVQKSTNAKDVSKPHIDLDVTFYQGNGLITCHALYIILLYTLDIFMWLTIFADVLVQCQQKQWMQISLAAVQVGHVDCGASYAIICFILLAQRLKKCGIISVIDWFYIGLPQPKIPNRALCTICGDCQ